MALSPSDLLYQLETANLTMETLQAQFEAVRHQIQLKQVEVLSLNITLQVLEEYIQFRREKEK